ncbi:Uncharacterised protein [Helicobacter fennelliae]|uniref:Uncharacterized protein n=1 Tax=Helicobacter fennelliae TaxID=215 RepID=A0A2X3B9V2_9HELI|nr:hypothetical protein [Helicobacter fennelliae]SQB97671.1 Uncharacterised protein [Helicobacter fennelliae]
MSHQNDKDMFEQILEEESAKLQNCQKSKNVDSCLKCGELLGCGVRKSYVNAVYRSMNKGQEGDFEF